MGLKRILQIPVPINVASQAAGSKLQLPIPLGYRYSRIDVVYIDGTGAPTSILTAFGDLELQVNSKTARIHSAAELDHLNGVNGTQYQAAGLITGAGAAEVQVLPLYFQEPWRKDLSQADSFAWNLDPSWGVNSVNLYITTAVALPATAQLFLLGYVDPVLATPKGGGTQSVKRVLRYDLPANGTANDFNAMQFGAGIYYQAFYFKNPSGASYIQYVTLKQDGTIIRDRISQAENIALDVAASMNPGTSQAVGAFGYDMILDWDDPINSILPVADDSPWLHLEYAAAASGNVRVLADIYAPFQ